MKFRLLSNKGFSLVEVVIAASITATIGIALMKMTGQSMKVQKTVRTSGEIGDVSGVVKGLLVNSKTCTETFAGISAIDGIDDADGFGIKVANEDGTYSDPIFTIGSGHGVAKSSKILSYSWKEGDEGLEVNQGFSQLIITFERKGTYTKKPVKIIPMWVKVNASNEIEACQALSMETSIWERSTADRSNIFYDNIPASNPVLGAGVVSIGVTPKEYVKPKNRLQVHKRGGKSYVSITSSPSAPDPSHEVGLELCSKLNLSTDTCDSQYWRFYSTTGGSLNIADTSGEWMRFEAGEIKVPGKTIKLTETTNLNNYTSLDSNGLAVTTTGNVSSSGASGTGAVSGVILNPTGILMAQGWSGASVANYLSLDYRGLAISTDGAVSAGMALDSLNGALVNNEQFAIGANSTYTVITKGGVAVSTSGAFTPDDISSGSVSGSIHNSKMFAIGSGVDASGGTSGKYTIMDTGGIAISTAGFISSNKLPDAAAGVIMNQDGFGVGAVSGGASAGHSYLNKSGLVILKSGSPYVSPGGAVPGGASGAILDAQQISIGTSGGNFTGMNPDKLIISDTSIGELKISSGKIDMQGTLSIVSLNNLIFKSGSGSVDFDTAEVKARKFKASSDKRLKKYIDALTEIDAVKNIQKLRPVSYYYKNDKNKSLNFGFIAQEVQGIYPNLVHEDDKSTMLSLDYMGFIAPIVRAMQYILNKISGPSDKLLALEDEVQSQRELIKSLEKRIILMEKK